MSSVRTAAGIFDLSHMAEIYLVGPGAALLDATLELPAGVVVLRDAATRVVLTGVDRPPVLSALRGFSAPVTLTTDTPPRVSTPSAAK